MSGVEILGNDTTTDDELLLLETAALDSFEAQAKREAGMARERLRAAQLYAQQSHQSPEHANTEEILTSVEGLHRRAGLELRSQAEQKEYGGAKRSMEEKKTQPKAKRRRRKKNPYANVPSLLAEIMCVCLADRMGAAQDTARCCMIM